MDAYPELFSALPGDVETDVVVIGAGITGVTAALRLRAAGKRVLVVDMDRVGSGETGHTTAHLTEVVDVRYHTIASDFGAEAAALVARGSREAILHIEATARTISATSRAYRASSSRVDPRTSRSSGAKRTR